MATKQLDIAPLMTDDTGKDRLDSNRFLSGKKSKWSTCSYIKISLIMIIFVIGIYLIIAYFVQVFPFNQQSDDDDSLSWIKLLSNDFRVEYYAEDIYNPRQMDVVSNVNESSTIIYTVNAVNYPNHPNDDPLLRGIYVLIDYESDSKNDKILKIFEQMEHLPSSVQYDSINNYLYITEHSIVYRCFCDEDRFNNNLNEQILYYSRSNRTEYLINDQCPIWFETTYYQHHGHHITKFHPITNNLCISFGAGCDVCVPPYYPRGKIFCFNDMNNPNIDNITIYANGVRDSVGFDFHPQTNNLWFTDHNTDSLNLGDNEPDCELNKISYIGQHFGFPYCHSKGFGDPYLREYGQTEFVIDPYFGSMVNNTCNDQIFVSSIQPLGPHVAPNGMLFYKGNMFDNYTTINSTNDNNTLNTTETYKYMNRSIFIAEHGSTTISQLIGYRVSVVFLGENINDNSTVVIGHKIFAQGWMNDTHDVYLQNIHGRPTHLAMLPDGSLLISDDFANAIYRVFV